MRQSLSLLLAAILGAACSGDASTSPTASTSSSTSYIVSLDSSTSRTDTLPVASLVPVNVHVFRSGSAVAGATVSWTVTAGHGAVSAASTTTDSLGHASIVWTLGDTVGVNELTAVSNDASVVMKAVAIPAALSTLARVTPDSAIVVAGASLSIAVKAVDRLGNAVSGATVTWSSSAGALTATSTTTGTSGNAETVFTSPATPGTYSITATLPGKASVTFTIVAL
jgi:hypothetical protein